MTTIPDRAEACKQVLRSIYNQVDFIILILNGYTNIPSWLSNWPKICPKLCPDNNLTDSAKWQYTPETGYVIVVDDDILYPDNYVKYLVDKIEGYKRKAVVTIHGSYFKLPYDNFSDKRCIHFTHGLDHDINIDILGTGTTAFHTDTIRPNLVDFPTPSKSDIWLSSLCYKKGIQIKCLSRPKNWLTSIKTDNPSLYSRLKRDKSFFDANTQDVLKHIIPYIRKRRYLFSIPCYNSEAWIGKCLDSLRAQDYPYWQAIIVDDCSADNSLRIIKDYAKNDDRISYISNSEQRLGLANFVRGISETSLSDEDVIIHLDGDDWLAHDKVVSTINKIYNTEDVWMTYGNYELVSGKKGRCAKPMPEDYDIRRGPWLFSVLKTFKYFLWKNVKDDDLRYSKTGDYYPRAWDSGIMRPMAEMAGKPHIRYVPDILYVYNNKNPNHCRRKLQIICDDEIRSRPRYPESTKERLINGIQ